MTRDEAKIILQSCRGAADEACDPLLAQARLIAESDPELMNWLREQIEFDRRVRVQLESVEPPPNLADRILAAVHADGRPRRTQVAWRQPLAWAAAVLLLGVAAAFWFSPERVTDGAGWAGFQTAMAAAVEEFPRLDVHAEQWTDIRRWMEQQGAGQPGALPGALERYPGIGCRALEWRGRRVLLICLAAQGEVVHLFFVARSDVEALALKTQPQWSRLQGWNAGSWAQGDTVCLALTRGSRELLESLVAPARPG